MRDDRTPQGWPLPHRDNLLTDDVGRIRKAFEMADAVTDAQRQRIEALEQHAARHRFEHFIGLTLGG